MQDRLRSIRVRGGWGSPSCVYRRCVWFRSRRCRGPPGSTTGTGSPSTPIRWSLRFRSGLWASRHTLTENRTCSAFLLLRAASAEAAQPRLVVHGRPLASNDSGSAATGSKSRSSVESPRPSTHPNQRSPKPGPRRQMLHLSAVLPEVQCCRSQEASVRSIKT